MGEIKVMPTVVTQLFLSGASVSGVAPVGGGLFFSFDNEVGGPFTPGETISWSAGASTGKLVEYLTDGSIGTMVIQLLTGSAPIDNTALAGGASGATADVDGIVASDYVADSEEGIQRGRYREFGLLADGGLIDIPRPVSERGYRVLNALLNLPNASAVELYIVDVSGNEQFAGALTLASGKGYCEFRNGGILVAPGCKFKVVATGALTGAGQFMLILGKGWGDTPFSDFPSLGVSQSPPGMQRPQV